MDYETFEQSAIAHGLVRKMSLFWQKEGYKFKAKIVAQEGNIFDIVSNIGPMGYPPRA